MDIDGFVKKTAVLDSITVVYRVWQESIPLKNFGNISPMKENFKIKFYMPMLCFYLQNCQILSNYV